MVAEFKICATCAVEHPLDAVACRICADERQWVPAGGQKWTKLVELAAVGHRAVVHELEPNLLAVDTSPAVGIGQRAKVICTPAGALLWDPVGYIDEPAVAAIAARCPLALVVASHPHMYGVQVEWSRAFRDVPIMVAAADVSWVARSAPQIETWSGDLEVLPGVTLSQPGGHFPGSAVAHWSGGADGRGVLLAGDTLFANSDRRSVSFMRSYPNHIALSGAVADRIATHVERFAFDRLYGNFTAVIDGDARAAVRRSADRHMAWGRGDHDAETLP